MDQKVILRFRNASRAGTTKEFPLKHFPTINIGRDLSCEVAFDADKDDLVSRTHSRIFIEGEPPNHWISDTGSRNGTYVNKQRISGRVRLMPGDVVQLGPGGPEFEFDVDPRPAGMVRATRLAADVPGAKAPALTREATPSVTPLPPAFATAKLNIGKATVERMITEEKHRSRKSLYAVAGIAVILLLATTGVFCARVRDAMKPKALTPTQIAQQNQDSVVEIEFGWKLIDTTTGRQLNQLYYPNVRIVKQVVRSMCCSKVVSKQVPLIPNAPAYLPVYVPANNGMQPLLTTESGNGRNKAVGGTGYTGSGFVVSSDGFILTNRRVAASWNTKYSFPDSPGVKLERAGDKWQVSPCESPGGWVPSEAKLMTQAGEVNPEQLEGIRPYASGKRLEGRNDYLDVTFVRTRIRVPAKLARTSDHIDVAMIKVDLPRAIRKCELNDNYESIKPGDMVTVMGYPGISPLVKGSVGSLDAVGARENTVRSIPDPTITTGNIARVIRGRASLTEPILSTFGDVYQLTINATGGGNSGGPVFDDQGHVVGIFTSEIREAEQATRITFSVPIRYGMELMGITKVM